MKIRKLTETEIYISHVGDGEYSFNVFGGAYTDLDYLLNEIVKNYNCTLEDITIQEWASGDKFTIHNGNQWIGVISIEQINPLDFTSGA